MNGTPELKAIEALSELGFNGLESEIYVFLQRESPATGYRIAQAISKPAANVYKALDTLLAKGAVELEDGKTRQLRPVPYRELLQRLERRYSDHLTAAATSLSELPGPQEDVRIYHLQTRDQVLSRCRAMLESAEQFAVLDIFPEPLAALQSDLKAAADRGLKVVIRLYSPDDIDGAQVVLSPDYEEIRQRFPAQWLNLVGDATEFLMAMLRSGSGEVVHAIWTASPVLSCARHSSLLSEIGFAAVRRDLAARAPLSEIQSTVEALHFNLTPEISGYQRLLDMLGSSRPVDASEQEV